ncbi:MAG: glycosyltransferase family 2 protein [Candidatus Saccharimonadales bacterium]
MPKKLLSIVLPSYNEERNVPLVYTEILKSIDTAKFQYEIIFINDGSSDDTWEVIKQLSIKDAHVRGINFSRNFGHAVALEAGLVNAKGDVIVMMDADLQHPPELIQQLIKKYDEGYDIVNTVRLSTEGAGILKKLTSKGFYKFINSISDLKLHDGEADYRLMSRKALNTLNSLRETPKFYRGLVNWIGYDVARVEYEAGNRMHGKSSYTLKKMLELARMGVTSFSLKPLKLIFTAGMLLATLSTLLLIAMLVIKFLINTELVSYNAILTVTLLLVTGILAIFQGVVALYLVDIFNATKGRPTYIIREDTGDIDEKKSTR